MSDFQQLLHHRDSRIADLEARLPDYDLAIARLEVNIEHLKMETETVKVEETQRPKLKFNHYFPVEDPDDEVGL